MFKTTNHYIWLIYNAKAILLVRHLGNLKQKQKLEPQTSSGETSWHTTGAKNNMQILCLQYLYRILRSTVSRIQQRIKQPNPCLLFTASCAGLAQTNHRTKPLTSSTNQQPPLTTVNQQKPVWPSLNMVFLHQPLLIVTNHHESVLATISHYLSMIGYCQPSINRQLIIVISNELTTK